jgi:hypothetical protein
LVVYREYYGVTINQDGTTRANVGLRIFSAEIGRQLAEIEESMPPIQYGVLDPSAFAQDGGPSHAENIYRGSGGKIVFRRADNKRVPGRGAAGGWDQLRARLAGEDLMQDGKKHASIVFMDNCIHAIRTIPTLQHDEDNVEDLDTTQEDHAADAIRYGCMSRPYLLPGKEPPREMEGIEKARMDDLWRDHDRSLTSSSGVFERI